MMELFIDRVSEDMSRTYDFDEDQLYNIRQLWKERFPTWLNEHRAELMQLTNEYMEALLAGEPPDPADVARWAGRMLPLAEEFFDLCEQVNEEMRGYLTDEQQVLLDGHMAGFRVGSSYLTQRLARWSEGGFDAQTEWPGSPDHRRAQQERQAQIAREAREAERIARGETAGPAETSGSPQQTASAPVAAASAPQDEWARYVEDFIRRYQLTSEQQSRAYKYLRSLQESREKYLRRVGPQLADAVKSLQDADDAERREQAAQRHKQLMRPLERMFTQLREKLDKLPTRQQRLKAAQESASSSDGGAKADAKAEARARP